MRIQDKNKIKKNSKLLDGGESTTVNAKSIHDCTEAGDLIGLQIMLAQNPSLLNQRDNLMEQTPLHIAASLNRVEIIKYLVEWTGPEKVELEARNIYGETPLHSAAKNGGNEAMRMLLQHGACTDVSTNNSMAPVHLAVGYALRSGDNSVVQTLSEYNADFTALDEEGMMPFNYLPTENEELKSLLCQSLVQNLKILGETITAGIQQHINNTTGTNGNQDDVQQIIYSGYNSTSYSSNQNGEDEMKGKMEEFDYELSKIVGLHDLKLQLKKWAKGILLDEKRRAMGVNLGPRKPPHMAFLGNPGTGKTTVARILGKLLHSVGVLSSDNVTEVQKTDLLGEFLGQTGPKTRRKIEEAMGGILFVDEAYQLAPKAGGEHVDYGTEALEEIMSVLEDGGLLVVFAGYTEPMKKVFSSNEGFCRRVTHSFQFEDYSCKDMAEMLLIKMSKQDEKSRLYGFRLHHSCSLNAIVAVIERCSTEKLRNKLNGGLVDNMLNNARENLDSRLSFESKGDELLTILLSDLEAGLVALAKRVNVDGEKGSK